jgi:hypothetical protein
MISAVFLAATRFATPSLCDSSFATSSRFIRTLPINPPSRAARIPPIRPDRLIEDAAGLAIFRKPAGYDEFMKLGRVM